MFGYYLSIEIQCAIIFTQIFFGSGQIKQNFIHMYIIRIFLPEVLQQCSRFFRLI